jgi:hypothetical protein
MWLRGPNHLYSFILFFFSFANAVTIYYPKGQSPLSTSTASANPANYTGSAAYDPTVLIAPDLPNPLPPTQFNIQLTTGAIANLSIPQSGGFFGFSVEFSVLNQVLGKNSSYLQVPFLNLMSNLAKRSGSVRIRVGGNTQDTATLVDSLPDGKILSKDLTGVTNPTQTPPLVFTSDIMYMMANISKMVNVRWYMGIPFNDTSNFRLGIAQVGQAILGDYLIGLQAGNEPDLYVKHGHRNASYGPYDYFGEFGALVAAMNDTADNKNRDLLIGPNIATGDWTPEMVWNTGFQTSYSANLAALAVEHYPTDNCFAQFGIGTPRTGQEMFSSYLNHTSGQLIVAPYLNSTNIAQSVGKPFLMLETNTASCGGFAGLSDSFGAALWGLDYALTMAFSNFSTALFHVGGQSVFYNPFTPPPTNQSTFHQWTIGPIYYSSLVMAEVLGSSNQSQVLDLNANGGNIFTPGYAIYENGTPMRVALFNYMTDPTGANDYTATISIGGGQTGQNNGTPGQVKVKYLVAPSVSTKANYTWAGQTFGDHFQSDGRPMGTEDIQTVTCDTNANTCQIKVPAPGFALVYLSDQAYSESGSDSAVKTFATTALTKTLNTATVDPAVLATSNGHMAFAGHLGSTSRGTSGAKSLGHLLPGVGMLAALLGGALVLRRGLRL